MGLLLSLDVCGHVWEHRKDDSAARREAHGKGLWICKLMAAGEGFEPSHTESESAVLPLHKPARSVRRSEQILL